MDFPIHGWRWKLAEKSPKKERGQGIVPPKKLRQRNIRGGVKANKGVKLYVNMFIK